MFEVNDHINGGKFATEDIVDAMNDFLRASGFGKKYMLHAEISSDSILGTHPDIAIMNDDTAPTEEEKAVIIAGLQKALSEQFGVEVKDAPEFLRTVEGRIPTRGWEAFKKLNPDAHERYAKIADLTW